MHVVNQCYINQINPKFIEIDRIYHWSLMQTKKSQPEGQQIMPEMRFTEFPALSVDPRSRMSRSASEADD